MKHELTKIVIVLVILVAGVVWLFSNGKPKTSSQPKSTSPATNNQLSQLQKSITGTVSNVIDSTVYFNTNGEYKRVILSAAAQIIKEVAVKDGPIKMLNVKITDIKTGDVIAVFYDTVSESKQEYTASKIEIISTK